MLGGISEQFSHLGNSIYGKGKGQEDWVCGISSAAHGYVGPEVALQVVAAVGLSRDSSGSRSCKYMIREHQSCMGHWRPPSPVPFPHCRWRNRQEKTCQGRLAQRELEAVLSLQPCPPIYQLLQLLKLSVFSKCCLRLLFSVHTSKCITW